MISVFNFITLSFINDIYVISSEVPRPRGVPLYKASLYAPDKYFTCLDNSQKILFSNVNDDYCDCNDASDEPGTAACPNGVFHCTNIGHKHLNIPSNRVNDGVCDCCDGTDEYVNDLNCPNTCVELGRTAREEAQRRAELIKAGKQMRQEYIQKGIYFYKSLVKCFNMSSVFDLTIYITCFHVTINSIIGLLTLRVRCGV